MQRLRYIRQLGFTFLIFPGAEHSRFSHALGTMHLAGRAYDAVARSGGGGLPIDPLCRERRLVRAAALLHDIGHAPFSHTAEDRIEGGIGHEEMTRRLLKTIEIRKVFDDFGDGITATDVVDVLDRSADGAGTILSELISSELDVDKMDYLRRDSLYCGVQYGAYDLERLIDTLIAIEDPESGQWRVGLDLGGVHALEALVMARYYMFTQVYFNATGKVMELHFNQWLRDENRRWPSDPYSFLQYDDVSVTNDLRLSASPHARAIVDRDRFTLAFETREHLNEDEQTRFATLIPGLEKEYGVTNLLIDHSAKDPHRLEDHRVLVRSHGNELVPMAEVSDFINQLSRIASYRVYSSSSIRNAVRATLARRWSGGG